MLSLPEDILIFYDAISIEDGQLKIWMELGMVWNYEWNYVMEWQLNYNDIQTCGWTLNVWNDLQWKAESLHN